MSKTICLTASFPHPPAKVYELYADSGLHSKSTGDKAAIVPKVGARMNAGGGYIKGTILAVEKNKLIVQTWRASDWEKADEDSILVVRFSPDGKGGTDVSLTHEGVPDAQAADLKSGWKEFYFDKWRDFLKTSETKGKDLRSASKPKASAAKPKAEVKPKTAAKSSGKTKAAVRPKTAAKVGGKPDAGMKKPAEKNVVAKAGKRAFPKAVAKTAAPEARPKVSAVSKSVSKPAAKLKAGTKKLAAKKTGASKDAGLIELADTSALTIETGAVEPSNPKKKTGV
jgi:uncharacterized protein YndB with AHSA1/START domain